MALRRSFKIHWAYLPTLFTLGCLVTYFWDHEFPGRPGKNALRSPQPPCNYVINRLQGFEYTQPVLSVEPVCESGFYAPVKSRLSSQIDSLKACGALTDASVYFREFQFGNWFSINESMRYHPASLMKVELLLVYLRMAEGVPGLLTQKIVYTPPADRAITPQFYNYPGVEAGKEYTVHDLLYYMIANSDNRATWLLSSRMDPAFVKKTFAELGLPEPVFNDPNYSMTPGEIAVFFKALFNSSLLSPEFSDYAAQLLSQCAFREGFVGGLPQGAKLWHKFGEWSGPDAARELHEAGVIYVGDTPYLLVVMTRGNNTEQLAGCIRVLTRAVYEKLRAMGT